MKKVLVALAVMSLASVASANLELVITANPDPGAGLESYNLTFKGVTAGDAFSAFDGRLEGKLSQCWYLNKGVYDSTPWSDYFSLPAEATAYARDTHLLFDPHDAAHVLIASDPEEDMDTGSIVEVVNGYDRALGTYMATTATSNMAFAVPVAHQTLNQPFAQVVFPAGEVVTLTGTGVGNNQQALYLNNVVIPEPATLGLLAVGAVGALIRRRR